MQAFTCASCVAFKSCWTIAELLPYATRGNSAIDRVTKKPHLPADGGGSATAHTAKSQGGIPVSQVTAATAIYAQAMSQMLHHAQKHCLLDVCTSSAVVHLLIIF